MKNKNWFWGFFFVLLAVLVLASQTNSFGKIGLMSLFATVLLVTVIGHSIAKWNFYGIFIPIAFLYMIYEEPLELVDFSSGALIFSAILASIGFSFIFHNHSHRKRYYYSKKEDLNYTQENIDNNNPYVKVSFGASSKYLHADCLKSGQFISSFGELEVFFDQAKLSLEGAEIFLDCSFGSIILFVPKHWKIVDNLNSSLGTVKNNNRFAKPEENVPPLIIVGNVHFGSVEIKYI